MEDEMIEDEVFGEDAGLLVALQREDEMIEEALGDEFEPLALWGEEEETTLWKTLRQHKTTLLLLIAALATFAAGLFSHDDFGLHSNQSHPQLESPLDQQSTSPLEQHSKIPPLQKELIPKTAFEEWKKYHSADILRAEGQSTDRKFVLGGYSCPDQAVHEFIASILIAMVTNRTLLWRFSTTEANVRQVECDQFLQGMMFEESMEFTPEVIESVRPYLVDTQSNELTVGIHSRHIRPQMDGSDVGQEVGCLDMVLDFLRQSTTQTCTILIMADRLLTLEKLQDAARERNCTAVFVENETKEEPEPHVKEEHGPFVGGAFFRDWYAVSQARSAFIHFQDRSSSEIVYDRMVYLGMTSGTIQAPIPRCEIAWRDHGKLHLIP
eukprot:scaffold581_cov169-Amphora_coffeaeformis.AAC.9